MRVLLRGFKTVDAGGLCYEVHKDFIDQVQNGVFFNLTGFEFPHAAVRKSGKGLVDTRPVIQTGVDENVDV